MLLAAVKLAAVLVFVLSLRAPVVFAQRLCDQYDSYKDAPFSYNANEWGADGSGRTCIEIDRNKSFSAIWNYASNPTKVHSYPNIGLINGQLPLQLSSLGTFTFGASWSMGAAENASSARGRKGSDGSSQEPARASSTSNAIDIAALERLNVSSNVALDMFLDSDRNKATDTTAAKYEVMIWLGTFGDAQPFGAGDRPDQTIQVGGETYGLSTASNQAGQTVYTWLASSNVTSITEPLNFTALLTTLMDKDNLPRDINLGTIQFGTETFHATRGQVNFTTTRWNFNLTLKQSSGSRASVGGMAVLIALLALFSDFVL